MTAHATVDPEIIRLLREAATWRVLARFFECPDAHWRADITLLARELNVPEVSDAASAIDDAATPGLYYALFGPGGPAPPREASYHESLELGSVVSDLAGYYEAFAYAPANDEPLDHVATEINFVSYLKFKEAYARARGDAPRARLARRAAAQFITDHLSRIAAPLAKLLASSSVPYLARASTVLAARVGPRPTPVLLPMASPIEDDQGDLTCGLQ
jgi:TorA maturation chaperone TorD